MRDPEVRAEVPAIPIQLQPMIEFICDIAASVALSLLLLLAAARTSMPPLIASIGMSVAVIEGAVLVTARFKTT